jgi:hypothetical protein
MNSFLDISSPSVYNVNMVNCAKLQQNCWHIRRTALRDRSFITSQGGGGLTWTILQDHISVTVFTISGRVMILGMEKSSEFLRL